MSTGGPPIPWVKNMRQLITIIAILTITGCSTHNTQPSLEDELDTVSDCFFDSVSILQREPSQGEGLGAFLAAAELKEESKILTDVLEWNLSNGNLKLSSGQEVFYRVIKTEHDDQSDGASSTFITYELFTKNPDATTQVTIELSMSTKE